MRAINRAYEVEGRSAGQPIVKFRESVIDRLGEPHVDYDQLEQLVHGDLGVPTDDQVKIKMYGRSAKSTLGGFHIMYTDTVHVNPMTARRYNPITGHMKVLFHELSHLSDSQNHRMRTFGEYILRNVAIRGGIAAGSAMGGAEITPDMIDGVAAYAVPLAAYLGYYAIDPAERRARKSEKDHRLMAHYADAIYFGDRLPVLDILKSDALRNWNFSTRNWNLSTASQIDNTEIY